MYTIVYRSYLQENLNMNCTLMVKEIIKIKIDLAFFPTEE